MSQKGNGGSRGIQFSEGHITRPSARETRDCREYWRDAIAQEAKNYGEYLRELCGTSGQ